MQNPTQRAPPRPRQLGGDFIGLLTMSRATYIMIGSTNRAGADALAAIPRKIVDRLVPVARQHEARYGGRPTSFAYVCGEVFEFGIGDLLTKAVEKRFPGCWTGDGVFAVEDRGDRQPLVVEDCVELFSAASLEADDFLSGADAARHAPFAQPRRVALLAPLAPSQCACAMPLQARTPSLLDSAASEQPVLFGLPPHRRPQAPRPWRGRQRPRQAGVHGCARRGALRGLPSCAHRHQGDARLPWDALQPQAGARPGGGEFWAP